MRVLQDTVVLSIGMVRVAIKRKKQTCNPPALDASVRGASHNKNKKNYYKSPAGVPFSLPYDARLV